MNSSRYQRYASERHQVVIIIVLSAVAILGLWGFLLRPQMARRRDIDRQWKRHQNSRYAHMSKEDLLRERDAAADALARMQTQWDTIRKRLSTYTRAEALEDAHVGNIDYKVELLNERRRLGEKSDALGIELVPRDLGMQAAVTTQKDARILLLKLRAIEKLADLALDRRISRLIAIEPLEPVYHRLPGSDVVYMEEFLVQTEFDVTLPALYQLMHSVFIRNRVFVFRQLRVNAGLTPDDPLRVNAVLSALIVR